MKDKSLGIMIIVIFGITGTATLLLAWLWPGLESERITATLAGSVGLFIALIQAFIYKQLPDGTTSDEKVTVNVEVKDRS